MTTVEAIKDFFIASGAGWVLWLLFALSVGSIAVAVERFIFFQRKSGDLKGLVGMLDEHLRAGDAASALLALEGHRSVGAMVASAGLRLAGRGPSAVEKGMTSALALQRKALEARLSYLGTLGNNAPFIGLFGTVIGVILAFEALGQAGPAASSAGSSQVASAAVMKLSRSESWATCSTSLPQFLARMVLSVSFMRRISLA